MKKLLLFLFILSRSAVHAQERAEIENTISVQQILNEYSDSVTGLKYGLTVLLKHNGQIQKASIGLASADEKFTDEHLFNIGSLTKAFTAVLVLQEIEKGKLNLSDTLGKFFSPNPNVDPAITIENLLNHSSGLGELAIDSIANPAFLDPDNEYNHTNLYFKVPPPKFKRDEKNRYCSTNTLLLGYILEKLNDKPYADLLRERIFILCGMSNSYPYTSKSIENLSHPMFNGQDLYEYLHYRYFANYNFSAGSITSNTSDLLNFFEHLYEKKTLVNESSLNKMTAFKGEYGLGLFELKHKGATYWGHNGDNLSYTVKNFYNPQNGDLFIIAGNHFDFKYQDEIVEEVLDKLCE